METNKFYVCLDLGTNFHVKLLYYGYYVPYNDIKLMDMGVICVKS